MDFSIYKISSPSGKSYIGYTSYPVSKRFREHKSCNKPVGKAIRKYGDKITLDIVAVVDNIKDAHILEKFYISMFNTVAPFGYNLTSGGEGVCGFKMPKNIVDRIAENKRINIDSEFAYILRNSGATYKEIGDIFNISTACATKKIKEYAEDNNLCLVSVVPHLSRVSKQNRHSLGRKHTDESKRKMREANRTYKKRTLL